MRRVVITSMGVVTPVGTTMDRLTEALRSGANGIGRISLFDPAAFPTQIAGEVDDFDPAAVFDGLDPEIAIHGFPHEDRKTALGVAAALQCAAGAGEVDLSASPVGVYLGTGLSSVTQQQLEQDVLPFLDDAGHFDTVAFGRRAAVNPNSSAPWRHVTDDTNRLVGAALGLTGPSTSSFSACAASLQAVGRAYRDVSSGRCDLAFAGGQDSMVHPFGMISFMRLGTLSTRNETPETSSRPFCQTRDGFVLAEGASSLLLEELGHAQARGATIHAEIVGYGTSIDAYMVTAPHPEGRGAVLAMDRALDDAGLDGSEIDYVNAHGTATALNDVIEANAIAAVFRGRGGKVPPISSTKSMMGHLVAAAGAVECAVCVAALEGQFLPPTTNLETLDPECDAPIFAADRAKDAKLDYAMTNSFGFGGQNGVLILKRWT